MLGLYSTEGGRSTIYVCKEILNIVSISAAAYINIAALLCIWITLLLCESISVVRIQSAITIRFRIRPLFCFLKSWTETIWPGLKLFGSGLKQVGYELKLFDLDWNYLTWTETIWPGLKLFGYGLKLFDLDWNSLSCLKTIWLWAEAIWPGLNYIFELAMSWRS